MATRIWQTVKICYCHHIAQEVSLEAEVVYPAEWLPDIEPARVLGHRCSNGAKCNLEERYSCMWAGTNPVMDPFLEKMAL
jgi:hypothetical protein